MLQNIYQDRDVVPGKLHALGKGKGKYARKYSLRAEKNNMIIHHELPPALTN